MTRILISAGLALAGLAQRHPKRLTAIAAALMLGGGGAAFAVAELGPDVALLPVHQVTEAVQPLPLQAQTEALDLHQFKLFRSEVTRSTDTAEALLQRLGLADPEAAAFLRKDPVARKALFGRAGRTVSAEASDRQELQSLTTRWIDSETDTQFKRLVIERGTKGFTSRLETAPYTTADFAMRSVTSAAVPATSSP